jgi:diguanylate cyclase (GGDEF)-like protein/PAS domain S-box-containing protein
MRSWPVIRTARTRASVTWRHLIGVLIGTTVVATALAVADAARKDADRHWHEQALVEQVRASSEQLSAFTWQSLLDSWASRAARSPNEHVVREGYAVWGSLSSALDSLMVSDHGDAAPLQRDADALYTAGIRALQTSQTGNRDATLRLEEREVGPALAVLARDTARAAALERGRADRAAGRAWLIVFSSLAGGALLLVLLMWRLHSSRQEGLLALERRALERRSEERIRALIEHSREVITVVDEHGDVRWQSSSGRRVLGAHAAHLVGRPLIGLVHPEDATFVEHQIGACASRSGHVTFRARLRSPDGDWRHFETVAENRLADPAVQGIVLSMRDVTERQALEEELRRRAFHDALTGLANRALFEDRLAHALAGARRHRRHVAVLFLDLDDFKTINDSLGHASGDQLLCAVAQRIAQVVRATDTAARLGGDEFAVLLDFVDHERDERELAERIMDALVPPFHVAGRELRVSASLGVAISDGARGAAELLRDADTAMYVAKERGKRRIQVFEPQMHRRVVDRLELTGQLQQAVELSEFRLDYQPIVDMESGRPVALEALVRWEHPQRGRLTPNQFIELTEKTGVIVPLGEWILHSACAQAAEWRRRFPATPSQVNVNVSTRQLYDASFPDIVASAMQTAGLERDALVLEITEGLLAHDDEEIVDRLHALRALGARIAVDDFGTGYSALSRLRHFPIDILKIDRTFIVGIEHDAAKAQLVQGILGLGGTLALQVVAEGVEKLAQARRLRAMGAPLAQGFLFAAPRARGQVDALLRDGKPLNRPMPVLAAAAL